MKILEYLISSKIFLGLNSLFVIVFSSQLYGLELKPQILIISFLVTFSVYNFNQITDRVEDKINKPDISSTRNYIYIILSVISLVLSFLISAVFEVKTIPIISLTYLFGVIYSFKLIKSIPRLKEIVGVKSITVAFCWSFTGSLLPASFKTVKLEIIILTFIYIFIQIFINTILFDIMDMDGDKISGLTTIPIKLGLNMTKKILIMINSFLVLWIMYCISRGIFMQRIYALIFSTIYSYLLILTFWKGNQSRVFVNVAVDGEWISFVFLITLLSLRREDLLLFLF